MIEELDNVGNPSGNEIDFILTDIFFKSQTKTVNREWNIHTGQHKIDDPKTGEISSAGGRRLDSLRAGGTGVCNTCCVRGRNCTIRPLRSLLKRVRAACLSRPGWRQGTCDGDADARHVHRISDCCWRPCGRYNISGNAGCMR